jgi:hypothetical protein
METKTQKSRNLQQYLLEQISRLKKEDINDIIKKIHEGYFEFTEEDYNIDFILNFELAQCRSKTEKALKTIAFLHHGNQTQYGDDETKVLSIVFTNNSLLEGEAWKTRTATKFKNVNIKVQRLASDTKKGSNDFTVGKELIAAFAMYASDKKYWNMIGDVLIMCNHPTRIKDMFNVIKTMNGIIPKNGLKFKYNIFFDECDSSNLLGQTCKFIKKIYDNNLTHLINEIQFITATPNGLIERLKRITPDADKLLNINNKLEKCSRSTDNVKDYHTIKSHTFLPFEGPGDPVEYIKKLSQDNPTIFRPGKIYFIPSDFYTTGHEKMANLELFKSHGLWVLILNGRHKEFRNPLGEKENIMQDLKGKELRDILRSWRERNPTAGLIITGNMVLERGLTFNTNGFNFDYMIISSYFAKKISNVIQLVGRGQGKKKFVDKFTVIMPQILWVKITKYIDDCEKILSENPAFYDENMLETLGKEDKFSHIKQHTESTLEKLSSWVKINIFKSSGKSSSIQVRTWKKKNKNDQGFIMHKFGESVEKVWSEEETLKQKGGIAPFSKRIFPCYSDLKDINTLKWYVFYRNE